MIERVQMSSATRSAIALWCLVAAGCAAITPSLPEETVAAAPPAASMPVDTPTLVTPEIVTAPARQIVPAEPTPILVAAPTAPAAHTVPEVTTATTPTVALPSVTSLPSAAPLDFTSLGARLRQTKTIGILAKLTVKSQADDLLEKFRAYHRRLGTTTLPELRRSYDRLLLEVLSLLQDGDPSLARDIVQSRKAILDILSDPRKFTESHLMAGTR